MKRLIISLAFGVLLGSLVWGGLAIVRHNETTPNAFNADSQTWVHIERNSNDAPGIYRMTHPNWLVRHAEITGFLAGDVAALLAWAMLLFIRPAPVERSSDVAPPSLLLVPRHSPQERRS